MYSDKVDKDKFYTKEEVVIDCLTTLTFSEYDFIIDPSAGNGVFGKNIKHNNMLEMDIDPSSEHITKQDWFTYTTKKKCSSLLIVGNPPFGKRNYLSKEFIKKALLLEPKTIAFILPNVYNKHTLQKIFPKTYKLQNVKELPKDSFLVDGKSYHVPCSFYVWNKTDKGIDLRFNPDAYQTNDFTFVTKPDSSCFFILGASPSTVKECSEVLPSNRGYYIKPLNKSKKALTNIFKHGIFKGNSGANGGVSWRTKPEIIKGYLEEIGNEQKFMEKTD